MSDRRAEPYPLEEPEASMGDLVSRLASDMGEMVGDHIELAKEEITAELKKAGTGVGLLGGGAAAGLLGAMMLSFAAAWGLAEVMDQWLAFLIVGLVWLVAAAAMATAGRNELKEVDPKPRETLEELREDKEWLKEQTS
jgi:uncharacterized membrane protein YqjE